MLLCMVIIRIFIVKLLYRSYILNTSNEFYFQWHFLTKCNLRCKHCYQADYIHGELSFDKLKQIADQIITALTKWNMYGRISLTGGEPLLSKSLFPLMDYLSNSERIISINILTNGTLLDEQIVDELKQYNKLKQIQISMDGGSAEEHDKVRGKGTFERALQGIRLLKNTDIEIALMFTLMNINKNSYMNFIHLAERESVDAITVERVTPCGNSDTNDVLTADEIKKIYFHITEYANNMKSKLIIRRARPLWINTKDEASDNNKIGGFCPVGLTAVAILWDGTVLPCRRLEIPLGNILEDGLFKIWYGSDVLWRIRDKNNLQGKCRNCKNLSSCGGCRAVAYAITGDYMEEDPQCWI